MGALQEQRTVVFGINRMHKYWDVPTPGIETAASTTAELAQPWDNIFSGHPALAGMVSSYSGRHFAFSA